MGNNPCRKIQLLGAAHPVVGITYSGIGGTAGDEAHPGPQLGRKWPNLLVSFCIFVIPG